MNRDDEKGSDQQEELLVSEMPAGSKSVVIPDGIEEEVAVVVDVEAMIAADLGEIDGGDFARRRKPEPSKKEYLAFEEANLDPVVLDAVKNKVGWTAPTPVQALCLPYSLLGRDLAGFAQTGTGKTGVFLITLAQRLSKRGAADENRGKHASPFAVILTPTRELAMQIGEECAKFFAHLGIQSLAVYGGSSWEEQAAKLTPSLDVIIATPGRLKDYYQKNLVSLKSTEMFVCDEVDRMFDMGFIDDVEFFLSKLNENSQKLVFSATTNDRVKELAFEYLDSPEYISVNPDEIAPEAIEQHALLCETPNKFRVLLGLLRDHDPKSTIIFANTRLTAAWLQYKLKKNGIEAEMITGDLPQSKRTNLIKRIKAGEIKALVATDVASRGIHISDITHVYNFDIPDDAANYIHRIGRTARAGAKGSSYSLVCEEYASNFLGVQELLGEMAPKSVWHDEKYLLVEDKSGNPFEDNFGKPVVEQPRYERYPERARVSGEYENRGPRRPEREQRPQTARDHQHSHAKPVAASAPRPSMFAMMKRVVFLVLGYFRIGGKKPSVSPKTIGQDVQGRERYDRQNAGRNNPRRDKNNGGYDRNNRRERYPKNDQSQSRDRYQNQNSRSRNHRSERDHQNGGQGQRGGRPPFRKNHSNDRP